MTEPAAGAAWMTIPFTVLLGRSDPLIPAEETVRQITDLTTDTHHRRPDIRVVEADHFMPFRIPETIAELILEPLP